MATLTGAGTNNQAALMIKRVTRLKARLDRINFRIAREGESEKVRKILKDESVMREAELTYLALKLKA